MKRLFKLLGVFGFLVCLQTACAGDVDFYISPTGDDAQDGSESAPVRTVSQAQQLAKDFYGKQRVNFIFMDGIHYLDECIRISPEQSGNRRHPVTYRAQHERQAVLNGGRSLALQWEEWKDGIYCAHLSEKVASIDQLYVNGNRKYMARYPNRNGKNVFDAWDLSHSVRKDAGSDMFNPERIARWAHPEGAYIHAMHKSLWGDMHWVVTGKEAGRLQYEGGWQNNRPSPMHPVYRMIEHVFEELDEPGEWYFDADGQVLYYYPEEAEDLDSALMEYVCLPELVRLEGTREDCVRFVNFQGLVFRNAARTFMENKEPLLRSDWTICRKGAVTLYGAEDCRFSYCEFDQVGGNAICVNDYNRRLHFYACHIHDSGANGIAFVGNPSSVRSPLFRYGPQDYEGMDRTPGPKNDLYPGDCHVEECLITRTGRVEKQTAPIQISMAYGIHVSHCSIYEVPRAGINVSEGTFGGHLIEDCDIFDTVLETGDHGCFNSWGRDRFWTPDIAETGREVLKDTSLTWLDMLAPNTIRHNRWRCDHGWDIDLDDGSSHYRICDNVLLSGGLKLREGYDRVVTNNIMINNTLHPHVWYPESADVFKHNIVFAAYRAIAMNVGMPDDARWGKEVDSNFFVQNGVEVKLDRKNGCDLHSLSGDPQFTDVHSGDYSVSKDSPARQVGFRNFDMQNFGVTVPYLKAIARTPELPEVLVDQLAEGSVTAFWHSAKIKNIENLGEQSATGMKDWNGVLVVSVPKRSELGQSGLLVNDVILSINGKKIDNVQELLQTEADLNSGSFEFKVWRNQAEVDIHISLY